MGVNLIFDSSLLFVTRSIISLRIGQHNFCFTPLAENGVCTSLKYCPQVVNLFTSLPQTRAKQYSLALQRSCGHQTTNDNYPVVCCTKIVADNSINAAQETHPQTEVHPFSTTSRTKIFTQTNSESDRTVDVTSPRPTSIPQVMLNSCRGPDQVDGICTPLENCELLLNRLKSYPNDEGVKRFLRASNKACNSVRTEVCCSKSVSASRPSGRRNALASSVDPRRLPTEDEGCGISQQNWSKVVGGEDSQIGAWPWMALIGYNAYSLNPFKCGGTLVSAWHVITAAHCIRSDLNFVRLGEFDISTESETSHVDINVDKIFRHPAFGRDGRNDLAILILVRTVEFTDLISPICMPTSSELRTKSYIRSNPFVAGWGRTMEGGTGSNILQQLQIPVQENSVCRNSFQVNGKVVSEQQFDESVICAGVLTGGRDTCQGDSGGPLMIPEPYKGVTRYYLIGVISYGIGCARIGVPGIYTSTQYLMDWITETIAQT